VFVAVVRPTSFTRLRPYRSGDRSAGTRPKYPPVPPFASIMPVTINEAEPDPLHTSYSRLLSLAPELILQILAFVPRSDLAKVAAVCRSLRDAAESTLWNEIWLMEPASFADEFPPLPSPPPTDRMVLQRTEARAAATRQIRAILTAGEQRPARFAAVTTINARTYRSSVPMLVTILDHVREHLLFLRVSCASRNVEFARWGPHDGFYLNVIDLIPSGFPLLTHLDIAPCHNASYYQLLRFLSLMPQLRYLKMIPRDQLQEKGPIDPPDDDPGFELPVLEHLSSIVFDFPEEDGLPSFCSRVFERSPNLRKLVAGDIWADLDEDGWSDEENGADDRQFAYFPTLSSLPFLAHLDWRCGSYHVFQKMTRNGGFAALETLVVDGDIHSEEDERIEVNGEAV
jgi:hypothetical protein